MGGASVESGSLTPTFSRGYCGRGALPNTGAAAVAVARIAPLEAVEPNRIAN